MINMILAMELYNRVDRCPCGIMFEYQLSGSPEQYNNYMLICPKCKNTIKY